MTMFLQNAGKYRHPITFQTLSTTLDKYGASTNTWTDAFDSRAGVYPVNGKQFMVAEQMHSEVTHQVHLRYMPNITPGMRIRMDTRYFTILSVINFQEFNKELQLMCKELVL